MIRPPPRSPLFPYPTLFRSQAVRRPRRVCERGGASRRPSDGRGEAGERGGASPKPSDGRGESGERGGAGREASGGRGEAGEPGGAERRASPGPQGGRNRKSGRTREAGP